MNLQECLNFLAEKVEPAETSKQALIREIQEELETSINIDEFFMNVNYTYPTFNLRYGLHYLLLKDEQITLNVHDSIKWITLDQQDINWIPADIQIIEKLKERGI